GVEIEPLRTAVEGWRDGAGELLPGRIEIRLRRGEVLALLRIGHFLGHAHRGDRRLQVGIGVERLLNERIERRRTKQRPPFARDIAAVDEVLGLATADIGRTGPAGQWLLGVPGNLGRPRMFEIRPDLYLYGSDRATI